MSSPTTLAIINQKGGVGKTTTVINLAASLSIMGQNTLVIDLDPQGNATTGLGKNNNDEDKNVYNLLIKKTNIENIIQKTDIKNLDLIGSHVNLSGLEVETANDSNRAFVLKEILNLKKGDLLISIKGTVDLITDAGNGVYESTDWKTGMRKDWATGEIKDFWKLCTDPQLRIYHYALTHLYPEAKQIVPSIYFINDGGPFTMAYDQSDIDATKEMLRKRFEKIKGYETQ